MRREHGGDRPPCRRSIKPDSQVAAADGADGAAFTPHHLLIKAHVFAAERLAGDNMTVRASAGNGQDRTDPIWTHAGRTSYAPIAQLERPC